MIKKIILISFFSLCVSSTFTNQETGWEFVQSTQQSFFMFDQIQIYGQNVIGDGCTVAQSVEGDSECYCLNNPNSCDVIGAFYNNDCIGWIYADQDGFTTVPAMGFDSNTPGTENYPSDGSQITFRVYDSSGDIVYHIDNPVCSQGDCLWSFNAINIYSSPFTLDNDDILIPSSFNILKAYPNPFNPSVNIDFNIMELSLVNINVYNILGVLVDDLIINEMFSSGYHSLTWQPENISSGEYIIKMTVNNSDISTFKVLYIK